MTTDCARVPRLRLIAMCASHLSSDTRLASLRAMLTSWAAQTRPIPLHLSVSVATPQLEVAVLELCASFQRDSASDGASDGVTPLILQLTRHVSGTLSQFQHYSVLTKLLTGAQARTLCDLYVPTEPTFVLFSDDDDTWHPRRVEHFHAVLAESEKQGELPRIYAALEESGPNDAGRLALEVRLRQSAIASVSTRASSLAQTRREYYHFAVRLSCLADFVTRCDAQLLRHRFADCFFVRYLLTPQGRDGFPDLGSDMKRFHANDGNLYSATVPLAADELQATDRAHSSPYDALAAQARSMLAQQDHTCQRLTQEYQQKRSTYLPRTTQLWRKELHDSHQSLASAMARHAKLVEMVNRLLIIDGFCCLMHERFTPPDFETFRRALESIEDAQDAVLGRTRLPEHAVAVRFPDALRPVYDKLVATDPEFLRFVHAPRLTHLPK